MSCFAACKDSDVILPGKREPISNFYKKTSHNFDKKVENRSLAFRPPKKRLNKNWVQGNGSPMYRTSNPALSQEANLFWSTQIGAGDSKRVRITADLVVSEGKIFTLDSQMVLTATSNTGKRLWSKDLTPKGERTGQADGGGLALGGSYDNAIVFDNGHVLTPGGLRYYDEAVRHKMLDALGDLTLAGMPIIGRYVGIRSGHMVTHQLLRKLFV